MRERVSQNTGTEGVIFDHIHSCIADKKKKKLRCLLLHFKLFFPSLSNLQGDTPILHQYLLRRPTTQHGLSSWFVDVFKAMGEKKKKKEIIHREIFFDPCQLSAAVDTHTANVRTHAYTAAKMKHCSECEKLLPSWQLIPPFSALRRRNERACFPLDLNAA